MLKFIPERVRGMSETGMPFVCKLFTILSNEYGVRYVII